MKHILIYYKKGTGTYVVSEPRPWARENSILFPDYDFDKKHPTTETIEKWLIKNKNFKKSEFKNSNITLIFNLDPNVEI